MTVFSSGLKGIHPDDEEDFIDPCKTLVYNFILPDTRRLSCRPINLLTQTTAELLLIDSLRCGE